MIVWDLRALRKTFPHIQGVTGMDKDAAKKKYYRAYELIYGKEYDPAKYERPEIKKRYLKRCCATCEQQPTCKELCPDVIGYVDQDIKISSRERHTDGTILSDKNEFAKWQSVLDEIKNELLAVKPEKPDGNRS